jgi:hypothetical protein
MPRLTEFHRQHRVGRRKPNLEVAAGDETRTAAARCDSVEFLRQQYDDEKL